MPVLLSRWDEVPTSRMVTLGKHGEPVVEDEQIRGLPSEISVDDWVKAAEFVPGQTWKKMMGMFIIIITSKTCEEHLRASGFDTADRLPRRSSAPPTVCLHADRLLLHSLTRIT